MSPRLIPKGKLLKKIDAVLDAFTAGKLDAEERDKKLTPLAKELKRRR